MKSGNYLKEKKEYLIERFSTKEGLVEFFVATAVWYFFLVKYLLTLNNRILVVVEGYLRWNFLSQYITYLLLSIIFSVLGFFLSVTIIVLYKKVCEFVNEGGRK